MRPANLDFTRVDDDLYPVDIILKQGGNVFPMTGRTAKIVVRPNGSDETVEVAASNIDTPTGQATFPWDTIAPHLGTGNHVYQVVIEGTATDPITHTQGKIYIIERLPDGTL